MTRRITVALVTLVLATMTVAALGTIVLTRSAERSSTLRRLEAQADSVAEIIPVTSVATDPADGSQRARIAQLLQLTGVHQLVIGPKGNERGNLPATVSLTDADLDRLAAGTTIGRATAKVLWGAAARTTPRGALVVTVLTADPPRGLAPALRWFAWSALAAVAIGTVSGSLLARRLARPVLEAAAVAGRISAGDLSARVEEPSAADELGRLGRALNDMAAQLEMSKGHERAFLMSVSHDLRTPLTSIRGFAEALQDGVAEPAAASAVILGESRRLERLIADLLDLAKLDARQFGFELATADPGEETSRFVDHLRVLAAARDLNVIAEPNRDASPTGSIVVDRDRLRQVLDNLAANACDFASTTVWLTCRTIDGNAVIEVADDGPGIAPGDLDSVFDRLYRADDQPRDRGGSGLGLAIARDLTTAMGGRIEVRSERGRGTVFSVSFPLA